MNTADIHFLVVEDQDFQRAALVGMLAGLGARHIVEASDGRSALEVLRGRTRPIDIVISDLEMPGMDGMEFVRHIGDADFPVAMILVSVHDRMLLASVGIMTEAYGISLLGTLEKPVAAERLATLIALYKVPSTPRPKPAVMHVSDADVFAALAGRMFEPSFQPKVDLATGRVSGAEALARWYHPERGIVSPYAFIPTLEANRRIDELTWIMLEKSAAACRDWRAAGLDATVSVNISLASLTGIGFADRITELVMGQQLDPRHMTLEMTETIAMTNIAHALENLARLRIKGFGLSIDDYGTGYSSLQQLSRIAFTELKIDQSFVMGALENRSCRVILESSLDIANKLSLKSVAEGVETLGDWELLKRLGCDTAQGYFIAKPMPAGKLLEWMAGWNAPA